MAVVMRDSIAEFGDDLATAATSMCNDWGSRRRHCSEMDRRSASPAKSVDHLSISLAKSRITTNDPIMTPIRFILPLSALCVAGSVASPIAAQTPASPDSSVATRHGDAPGVARIAALLAPEVGMAIGSAIDGRTGAIVGIGAGLVIGTTIAVLGARHQAPSRPDRPLCLVPGTPGSPPQIIPGSPGSPAIGDSPGTPPTPDIIIPGSPSTPDRWEACG